MRLVVIADAYPPMKTSGAVQIRDLVAEMTRQGHHVTLLLPDANIDGDWKLDQVDNLEILRLKAPETKDVSYLRRAIAEYLLSSIMYRRLKKSPLASRKWDAIVWYSPTIFFGKLVRKLKKQSGCSAYLILRDIFPEWAVDMGLLGKGPIYSYFKRVEKFQYRQADTIGVQTPSNLTYFRQNHADLKGRVEVLNNWLSEAEPGSCRLQISETRLAGRRIFVYTGNIGIAQGMDILVDLAREFREDAGTGFLFVGRGTAVEQIKSRAADYALDNLLFSDEIPPEEIPGLLAQCDVGLIALDPRHRNDNIPGKFLAYMQSGLPVLATINRGNDLEVMIRDHDVGGVITSHSVTDLAASARELLGRLSEENPESPGFSSRCKQLAASHFSSKAAVTQIIASFS